MFLEFRYTKQNFKQKKSESQIIFFKIKFYKRNTYFPGNLLDITSLLVIYQHFKQ